MKKDGIFISSGIIDIKKDEVEAALLENGFEIVKITRMGDWFSFQAKCKKLPMLIHWHFKISMIR